MKAKSWHNQQQQQSDKHFISRLQWLLFAQLCLENVLGQKLKSKINSIQQTLNLFTWLYSVQHSTSNTIAAVTRNKHTQRFLHIYPLCMCVSVCASSVQGFSMHYDTSETATKTERQRRTETETGRERQSSYSQMNDWQIAELCTLHILPHKLCPNVVRVWVCGSVCQSNFSLALLLKCEWQLDALIVTMNCISSAIPCSVYATADSC